MHKVCVLYHGLGSKPAPSRINMLNDEGYVVLCEQFDYHKEWEEDRGESLFKRELKKIRKVDLIVGISFGGYLAYKLSKATGIDTLLINPALNRDRSKSVIKHYNTGDFNEKSKVEIFFGESDTSVTKEYTHEYLESVEQEYISHIVKGMAHRIPDSYFKYIIENSKLI